MDERLRNAPIGTVIADDPDQAIRLGDHDEVL